MKVKALERIRELPTPLYLYDTSELRRNLEALKAASEPFAYHVHYAVKANSNPEILRLIQSYGLGADCVSGNEVLRAMECGFPSSQIAFAGVGKSDKEIQIGLENDIFSFNVESIEELKVIDDLARTSEKVARIALRLNPNVNAYTHAYITTGLEENKFGINAWELDTVLEILKGCKNLQLTGLHFHIGSQITDLSAFKNLCIRVNEIQDWFQEKKIIVEHINVGGGLGVNYSDPSEIPDYESFFGIFSEFLSLKHGQQLHFELGRAITAQMGSLISRVLYIKKGIKTNFIILDAGMTELIRPALYQATHKIENWSRIPEQVTKEKYDVVGPICESSDSFGKSVLLPETKRGDIIAIRSAGAYGEVMASSYNLREKAQVLIL